MEIMIVKASCQNCGQNIEFDDAHLGYSVKCPHCFEPTVLSIPQNPPQPSASDLGVSTPKIISSHPATENQLDYIRDLGGNPAPDFTMTQASQLIDELLNAPDVEDKKRLARERRKDEAIDRRKNPAQYLRQDCESAKRDLEKAERGEIGEAKMILKDALDERLEFWKDVFQSPVNMESVCEQKVKLYLNHGFKYKAPSEKRIQAILDALDANSAIWDKVGMVSFFMTLEASFPELARKNIDWESYQMDKEWLDFDFGA